MTRKQYFVKTTKVNKFNKVNKFVKNFKINNHVLFLPSLYLELVYLVTALVPSDTACLANSPGKIKRTAV